eukprot:m.30354 g.30354  ORF g.30354 m.30354 type:complete len:268 (+) comp9633_c0_seq1:91-894(+)
MEEPQEETKRKWTVEQEDLKKQLVCEDLEGFDVEKVKLVGGVDISFVKGNAVNACVGLIVWDVNSCEVVYEDCHLIELNQPYIPGFLAFREVPYLLQCVATLREKAPDLVPDVIMVDGNGVLHPRGFGLASHLGVITNIPTIGVGKKLFLVDGLDSKEIKKRCREELKDFGDALDIVGDSGRVWGAALRRSNNVDFNPVYVSIGHNIGLPSAVQLINRCGKCRVPEPVRQADQRSRTFLRDNFNDNNDNVNNDNIKRIDTKQPGDTP